MQPALFTALITPFHSDGSLDLAAIPDHLRWLEANGIDGVVPCGTTGEGPSLSLAERKAVIDAVLVARGSLRVIAGTGCGNLAETIEATNYAITAGAEAALVVPPYFFKGVPEDGLLHYYRALCDALPSGGKIVLYHIPPISQIALTRPLINKLVTSHPQAILGLKDSGGDDDYTAMLIAHYPQLQIFDGYAPAFAHCLADGGAGGIFALANLFPREFRAVVDAFLNNGNLAAAQAKISAIEKVMKPPIPAIKAILPRLSGLAPTAVRSPLLNLSPDETERIWQQLVEIGINPM
jgi:4-hydroxy-tetrahydrodipicolinate synthase